MSVATFGGQTYEPKRDGERLTKQVSRIRALTLTDGGWFTLEQLAAKTGFPQASVSARLRDLRKPQFGGYTVERKHIEGGLWAYRVTR